MTDRELLELAAKAAGEDVEWLPDQKVFYRKSCNWPQEKGFFLPLHDDGEALRLAASLRIDVLQDADSISVKRYVGPDVDHQYLAYECIDGDRLKATRRAIVRAAAEIGKTIP